jgi:hypothetical protein
LRITAHRLPPEVTTLYAELVEQLTALEARRAIGHAQGSFVTKTIKGQTYLYFQQSLPGGRPRQVYVGPRSPALDAVVRQFADGRAEVATDRAAIERLCALLRAGGASVTDSASGRVLGALADAGVFRLGGVLVGTHAFVAIGNMLGVRWEHGLLRTQDIDVAGDAVLGVAVPDLQADIPAALESLRIGFLPVPGLSARSPSTSFKVRGRSLRVDLVTPATGRPRGPVVIRRFKAAAEPLAYLEYVLERPASAAVIDGAGVLVHVPDPARFALHKLIVARRRPPTWQAKRDKDLRQAAQLVELLAEDRPGDLAAARAAITARGAGWKKALVGGVELLSRHSAAAARAVREA